MKNNYFGILSDYKSVKYNKIVEHCIESGIYVEEDISESETPGYLKTYLPSKKLHGSIFFKNKHYSINEDIVNQLYNIASSYMNDFYTPQFSRFKKSETLKLNSFINLSDKEKYIQRKILKLNRKGLKNGNFVDFMGEWKESEKDNFIEWKELVIMHLKLDDYWVSDYLFGISLFSFQDKEITTSWEKFIKIKTKITFFENELKTSLIQTKSNYVLSENFEKAVFIDELRDYDGIVKNKEALMKCLAILNPNSNSDLAFQLDKLYDILNLPEKDYLELTANQLAEIAADITDGNKDGLRKKFAILRKPKDKLTEKQMKEYDDKYENACDKISLLIQDVFHDID